MLTREEWAEDIQILRRAMVQLHPGLYRFNTPEGIESAFRSLEAEFERPRSLRFAFLAFSRFTASIRCGHTYPNPWNQNEATALEVWKRPDKLPFLFHWDSGHMVVTASATDQLRPGDVVAKINGIPAEETGARLLRYIKADGSNAANRWAQLELTGIPEHEAWDIYQPLVLPPEGPAYRLQLAIDESPEFVVPALSRGRRAKALRLAPANVEDQWSYEVLDNRLAHVRMRTFAVYNTRFDWKAFLARMFGDIRHRGLRHIALDIRGNAGGSNDVLVELAKYIVWQPAVMPGTRRLVRYETVPADLHPFLNTWDKRFFDRGKLPPAGGGFFVLQEAEREALEPTPDAVIAKYYLLTDGHNSSAAFTLAEFLQENKLATLIGETTGGNQRGINGGQFFFLKLPNSGLEIDIPLIASVPVEAKPDAGLPPDVRTSPEGALAAALRLARRE